MRVRDLWASTVVTQSEDYKAAINDLAASIQANIGNMALMTPEQADTQAALIQGLVDQFGVSWDQAYADVKASMDKSRTEMSNLTDHLESEWNKQQAAASGALPAIAKWFDEAFSEGRFADAANLVQSFADNFGISFDQAETIIEDFKEKTKEIPQTIEQQLVGEAQARFETFKNCMSGKALTLSTDVKGTMQGMSDNIVDLINKGLVGEAQNEMQAYVNCSTSKMSDMVLTINGYMTDLTTQHNEKLATLTEAARTAFGAEKDAILAAIGEEVAGYEAKMNAFNAWQQALYAQMIRDAASLQAGINAVVASAAASLASIRGNYSAASAILSNLFAVTKSAKEVAALAAQFGGGASAPPTYLPGFGPEAAPAAAPPTLPPLPAPGASSPGPTAAGVIGLPEAGTPSKEAQPIPEKIGAPSEPPVPIVIAPIVRSPVIQVNAPLIQVQGSADMATVNKAVEVTMERLRNVIVEPTSSGALSTSKMIRGGNAVRQF